MRNNYYHDVDAGPSFNMGYVFPGASATSLAHAGVMATCDAGQAHGLTVGQFVFISNTHIGGNPSDPDASLYNGFHIVESIISDTEFTYKMTTAPDADADSSPDQNQPIFQPVGQIANLVFENNIFELGLSVFQGYWPQPTAIGTGIDSLSPAANIAYAFRQLVLRENVIRQLDGQLDPYHFGITIRNSEKLVVEDNVIDVGGSAVKFNKSVAPYFFNNHNSAGKILQGYDEGQMQSHGELATGIEDALLLSL